MRWPSVHSEGNAAPFQKGEFVGGALRAAITLDVSSGSPDGVRLPHWFYACFLQE